MDKKQGKNFRCVVNLHKRLNGIKFKERSPRAVKIVREYVKNTFSVKKIRIDTNLNKFLWKGGPKTTSHRLKLIISKDFNLLEDGSYQAIGFVRLDN